MRMITKVWVTFVTDQAVSVDKKGRVICVRLPTGSSRYRTASQRTKRGFKTVAGRDNVDTNALVFSAKMGPCVETSSFGVSHLGLPRDAIHHSLQLRP